MDIHQLSMRTRTVIGAASMATLLVGGAASAFAAGTVNVSGNNGTTGQNSVNTNTSHISDASNVVVSQFGSANNNAHVTVSSGNNLLAGNTTVGDFTTGDVMVTGMFTNSLNSSTPIVVGDPTSGNDVMATFGNTITGQSSTNHNSLSVDNDSDVHVTSNAVINNNVGASLSNGNNSITGNTSVGDVTTGALNFGVTSTNTTNSNPVDLSSLNTGASSVTVTGSNGTTGQNSSNTNTTDVNNNSNTSVNENSNINNNFGITTSTGNNNINGNTTVGGVNVGGATVSLTLDNSAN